MLNLLVMSPAKSSTKRYVQSSNEVRMKGQGFVIVCNRFIGPTTVGESRTETVVKKPVLIDISVYAHSFGRSRTHIRTRGKRG